MDVFSDLKSKAKNSNKKPKYKESENLNCDHAEDNVNQYFNKETLKHKTKSIIDSFDLQNVNPTKLRDIIESALNKGIFLSPDIIDIINDLDFDYESLLEKLSDNQDFAYLNDYLLINHTTLDFDDLNWKDFEKAVVELEVNNDARLYESFINFLNKNAEYFNEDLNSDDLSIDSNFDFDKYSLSGEITLKNKNKFDENRVLSNETSFYNRSLTNKNSFENDYQTDSTNSKKDCFNMFLFSNNLNSNEGLKEQVTTPKKNSQKQSDIFSLEYMNNLSFRRLSLSHPFRNLPSNVEVLFSYQDNNKSLTVDNFVSHYRHRLNKFIKILSSRSELQNLRSISKLKGHGEVSIIGLISNIVDTKNAIFLDVEDLTGTIRVIISKDNEELMNVAKELVLDQAIGVFGFFKNNIIYAKTLVEPGIPNSIPVKKSPDDVNLVVISDLHVGSKLFLEKEFLKFIDWINGKYGNEQHREMGLKTKYLLLVGDIVDGVGVYPSQKDELRIKSIRKQYDFAAYLLSKIRKDVTIVVSPGNHDAVRLAEPQPPLDKDFAKSFYELENVVLVSNPAYIRIHKVNDFEGFKILMYHGYSFDYYIRNIDSLRQNGGFDRFDLVMKFLLNKRHLSPSHGGTLFVPDPDKDPLIIEEVPDIFVVGHNHRPNINIYNNVILISGGTWQLKTPFQEKIGHDPLPGRVPVINLKTRKINLLRFV